MVLTVSSLTAVLERVWRRNIAVSGRQCGIKLCAAAEKVLAVLRRMAAGTVAVLA